MTGIWRGHRRKVLAGAAALVLLMGGLWWWKGTGDETLPAVHEEGVVTGSIEEVVTAQGKLEPKTYVNVGAQVSGQLQKLYVQAGDSVKEGDPLAEIDPRVYQARVEQGQASLNSLKAQLAEQEAQLVLARLQHERNAKLVEVAAISKDAFDTSTATLNAAVAKVNSLKAQMAQAASSLSEDKTNLGYTKIFAPMAGTVVSTSVQVGQTLNASQQAPTLARIADLSVMTVRAQVAEADVNRLQVGMPVYFTTLGSERKWHAKVGQVLPAPEVVNDVVLYNVLVDVENPDGALMDGMSAQMSFVVGSAKDVPVVPVAALARNQEQGTGNQGGGEVYRVKVVGKDGKPEERTVVVGLMDRTSAEVKSGLKVGDKVLVTGAAAKKGGSGSGRNPRMPGPML